MAISYGDVTLVKLMTHPKDTESIAFYESFSCRYSAFCVHRKGWGLSKIRMVGSINDWTPFIFEYCIFRGDACHITVDERVALCFDYSAIYLVLNAENVVLVAHFGILWRQFLFLGQRLIHFVRENYCNCARLMKFHVNEFFKRAYKISKLRPHKRIFDVRKWILRRQFTQCQCTITRPKLP
jgi:hypothetical protein